MYLFNTTRCFHIFLIGLSGFGAAAVPNAAPPTMPSLREWIGGEGMFILGTNALIAIDGRFTNELTQTAFVLKDDLKQFTGQDCKIISLPEPQPGSLFLTLNNSDAGIGDEGYLLQVGDAVTIRANTGKGIFYGAQTLLQMLKLDATHSMLPKGTARDYPLCKDRDEMRS